MAFHRQPRLAVPFRHGIVATPNDFGEMGAGQPTATARLAGGGVPRQRPVAQATASAHPHQRHLPAVIRNNRGREHRQPKPIPLAHEPPPAEAEALRDSVLVLSGKMKFQMYGPGFRDFVLEHPALATLRILQARPRGCRIHRRSSTLPRALTAAAVHDHAQLRRPLAAGGPA